MPWWLAIPATLLAAAAAVLAGRAYLNLRRERDQLLRLLEVARATEDAGGLEAAVAEVLSHARRMFGASFAEIQVPVGEREVLLATLRRNAHTPAYARKPAEDPDLARRLRRHRLRAALVAPLAADDDKGALLVANPARRSGFDPDALANLQAFALRAGATLKQIRQHEHYRHRAFHDALTNLANRALFADRLEQALRRTRRLPQTPAVLLLDLDDFKAVNDSLGHAAGDQLLIAVAERLHGCLRPHDTAARLGGDEFAVLLEDASAAADAVGVAERVVAAMAEPVAVAGRSVSVRASVGIALAVPDEAGEDVLHRADLALYHAKVRGKAGWALYESLADQPTFTTASA